MRGRPDVDLRLPPVVHPGAVVETELVVTSGSDTPIRFVDLVFTGEEELSLEVDGRHERTVRPFTRAEHRLRDAGTLTEGTHRFAVKLEIPEDAPPSYVGVRATIRYELNLHVSIPWWPDLRETFELLVEPRPSPRPRPTPARQTSPQGKEPFVELSLVDVAFAPNDEVVGAFAIGNVPRRDDFGVEISLVATEHADVNGVVYRAEQFRFIVPTIFQTPAEGGEVAFRFRVPREVVPSFKSRSYRLEWAVHAALRLSWARVIGCSIPVVIDRHKAPRAGDRARLEIGAARWRRVWSEAGRSRALTLAEDRLVLLGARGDVQIEVLFDRDDEDEHALVATLRYPSLGLDLLVVPQLIVVLPSALELRVPRHRIQHREAEQAEAFLTEPLVTQLRTFKTIRADDTRLVVRSPAAGFDEPGIGRLLDRVTALVDTLIAAIEAVPPPAAMKDALPAWRVFAAATGARLCVGGMALLGASVDGAVLDVTTRFGARGEVTATVVQLQIDPPLDHRVDLADPSTFSAALPGCRELAMSLQASTQAISIDPQTLTIAIDGPTFDPADLRPRMIEMLVLARRLRGERSPGPYR